MLDDDALTSWNSSDTIALEKETIILALITREGYYQTFVMAWICRGKTALQIDIAVQGHCMLARNEIAEIVDHLLHLLECQWSPAKYYQVII